MKPNKSLAAPTSAQPGKLNAIVYFLLLFLPLEIIAFSTRQTDPLISYCLMLFSGWLGWTFIEYFNHCFRMHGSVNTAQAKGYERHMQHHNHPTHLKITGLQRLILLAGNIGLIFLCIYYKNGVLVFTGLYMGFVLYTLMHWFLHKKLSAKWFPGLHHFHIHHHCRHPDRCFGVTVTWWDHLFDTIPYHQREITDRIKKFYYKSQITII